MDVEMYERALRTTGKVVAGTTREQLGDSTQCPDWSVRDLLNHIIGGCITFSKGAAGEPIAFDSGIDHTAGDHVATYESASQDALEAFSKPGALNKTFNLPWGDTPGSVAFHLALAEAAVHGWDLATATGQEAPIDDDIAEEIYGTTSSMMEPKGSYPRGESFGEPIDVPDDAPAPDRMLAYLGRRP